MLNADVDAVRPVAQGGFGISPGFFPPIYILYFPFVFSRVAMSERNPEKAPNPIGCPSPSFRVFA
jgi:hypothetical protein